MKNLIKLLMILTHFGCGKSIFTELSKNTSDEALLENARQNINNENYGAAEKKLSQLWSQNNSLKIGQLYATSLVGLAGFDLFTLLKKSLESIQNTNNVSGVDLMNKISSFFNKDLSSSSLNYLERAIDVLNTVSPTEKEKAKFQRCLISTMYSIPIITKVESSVTLIQNTFDKLPKTLPLSGSDCIGNQEQINEAASQLNIAIQESDFATKGLKRTAQLLSDCLIDFDASELSSINSKLNNITRKIDKGCVIPQNQLSGQ